MTYTSKVNFPRSTKWLLAHGTLLSEDLGFTLLLRVHHSLVPTDGSKDKR